MLDKKEIIAKLTELAHLDIDAVKAYDQALDNIEMDEIREQLSDFRTDHERHIRNLSSALRSFGAEAPSPRPDMKGFFITAFTAIRSAAGTEGALKAMASNEKMTTSKYDDALNWKLPSDLKEMVRSHFADEQRHLSYIERTLVTKPWETVPAV